MVYVSTVRVKPINKETFAAKSINVGGKSLTEEKEGKDARIKVKSIIEMKKCN